MDTESKLNDLRILIDQRNSPRIDRFAALTDAVILKCCDIGNSLEFPMEATNRMWKRRRAAKVALSSAQKPVTAQPDNSNAQAL